jgi:hypothetical protein
MKKLAEFLQPSRQKSVLSVHVREEEGKGKEKKISNRTLLFMVLSIRVRVRFFCRPSSLQCPVSHQTFLVGEIFRFNYSFPSRNSDPKRMNLRSDHLSGMNLTFYINHSRPYHVNSISLTEHI